MKLAVTATRIARTLVGNKLMPDEIRLECDVATGGELATRALDTLADMVERRLEKPDFYGLR